MVNTPKSILHRAAFVHTEVRNDRQSCQFLDEKSQMLSTTHTHTHTHTHVGPRRPLPFSSESPAPFPHPPLSLSCSLSPMPLIDYRSDKKLRPVKSEPDRTCLFCSQKRTEIKHLWNCCDHNLQNAELLPAVGFPNQRFHNRDAGTTAWKFYLYQNAVILGQGRAFHTVKVPL